MAYGDGLENRCRCKPTVGSNPTPSAKLRLVKLINYVVRVYIKKRQR